MFLLKRDYSNKNFIIKGFITAILLSSFIYLSYFNIENKILNTILGLLGIYFLLIIPKKAISEIQKLFFDTIEMFYDENTLIASASNFLFFTKLINGKFPDYERIIPKNKNFRIQLSRELMVESIKQIAIISNEIKITFKSEKVVFESLNDDNIEAKTEIEYKTGLDEDIFLAVNSRYMLDFLSHIESQTFTLGFNDSGLPFTLESDNFITIVMPIML